MTERTKLCCSLIFGSFAIVRVLSAKKVHRLVPYQGIIVVNETKFPN